MMNRWNIGAYWGPRRENVDACAERVVACLDGLAQANPTFSGWRMKSTTKAKALAQPVLDGDLAAIRATLLEDADPVVPGEKHLGFPNAYWNGQSHETAASTIEFNLGSDETFMSFPNNLFLDPPQRDAPGAEPLQSPALVTAVIAALVTALEPDTVICFTSNDLEQQPIAGGLPYVGWITYLRDVTTDQLPDLPDHATAEPLGDGILIQLTPDRADTTPEDILDLRNRLITTHALHAY